MSDCKSLAFAAVILSTSASGACQSATSLRVVPAAAAPAQSRLDNCDGYRWRVETPDLGNNKTFARLPSIASTGSEMFVAGDSITDYTARMRGPLLRIYDRTGVPFRPMDSKFGAYPQVIFPGSGSELLAMWGEIRDLGSVSDWPPDITSIWSTSLGASGAWSAPERVYAGDAVMWDNTDASRLKATANGRLAVAFRASRKGMVPYFVVARRVGGQWRASELPVAMPMRSPDVIWANGDTLVAVYSGQGNQKSLRGTSLRMTWSGDLGATWSQPREIAGGDDRDITYTRLGLVSGRVQVIWLEEQAGHPLLIRHLEVTVTGEGQPQKPDDAIAPNGLTRIRIVSNKCGIHVMGDDFDGRTMTGSVLHVRWFGRWMKSESVFSGYLAAAPDAVAMDDGSLLVVANARLRSLPPGQFGMAIARYAVPAR